MKVTVKDMKDLMLKIGMKKEIVEGLDPAKPLGKQGVDSVDCPAFMLAFEKKYAIKVSDTDNLRLKTINDFVAFVNR